MGKLGATSLFLSISALGTLSYRITSHGCRLDAGLIDSLWVYFPLAFLSFQLSFFLTHSCCVARS